MTDLPHHLGPLHLGKLSESELLRLAEEIAFAVRPGDCLLLQGDLGAGKTTLARALIRALLGDDAAEIPSPTFTILQTYDAPRMSIAHLDLYRLADASEIEELGLADTLVTGIALIEWPERAEGRLPEDHLRVRLADTGDEYARTVTLAGSPSWRGRIERLAAMRAVIRAAGWTQESTRLAYFQGDASPRRYARLTRPAPAPLSAIVMDAPRMPDGPPIRDGKPYSRIAHLAEDVRPFVAVANALHKAGVSAPGIDAHDLAHGLLVVEDLGAGVFGEELRRGASQSELWHAAVDVLAHLRGVPLPAALPLPDDTTYSLPPYDASALAVETELILDWYWLASKGAPVPADARAEFTGLWAPILARLASLPRRWVLRDYHSPNLIWRPERKGLENVGVIDFQDALAGPAEYDLVSLLQDARLDVPPELEARLLTHYCAAVAGTEAGGFDREAFAFAYAALGAQRNTKIAGIFTRLARRDGKPQYLAHMPRIWRYLARDLAHPELAKLAAWYEKHFPAGERDRSS
jgi:tRNA threonylcarbamoyl adenosine modification protein YjeE